MYDFFIPATHLEWEESGLTTAKGDVMTSVDTEDVQYHFWSCVFLEQ